MTSPLISLPSSEHENLLSVIIFGKELLKGFGGFLFLNTNIEQRGL